MKLRVQHQTVYRYEKPIPYSIQTLRVSPRAYEGCAVLDWSVRGEGRRELPSLIDGFGNLTHCHTVTRPHAQMTLSVEGEVETTDTAGVVEKWVTANDPGRYTFRVAAVSGKQVVEMAGKPQLVSAAADPGTPMALVKVAYSDAVHVEHKEQTIWVRLPWLCSRATWVTPPPPRGASAMSPGSCTSAGEPAEAGFVK